MKIALGGLILTGSLTLGLLGSCSSQERKTEPIHMEISEINEITPITIPEEAQDLKIHQESGINDLIVLRFRLSEETVETFITSNELGELLKNGYRPFSNVELKDLDWWDPEGLSDIRGGYGGTESWAQEILIGKAGTDAMSTVYYRHYDL